jgi:hypothetical protein
MRMILRCSGGFTGPAGAQTRTVDLAQLPRDRASELEQMVVACDFFALPDKLVKDAPKSWDFQYDLEVDQGQQPGRSTAAIEGTDRQAQRRSRAGLAYF